MISRHDRHERAAPRQFHELFERCLFHDSPLPGVRDERSRAARSITRGGRRHARPPLELQARLRRRASRARRSSRRPPRAPTAAASSPAGCRRGRRRRGRARRVARERRRVDVRPRADRRGVDEHVPAAARAATRRPRRRARAASARAAIGAPRADLDARALRLQRPDRRARRAAGAEHDRAASRAATPRRVERREETRRRRSCGLPSRRGPRRSVLTAPTSRVDVVGRRRVRRSSDCLERRRHARARERRTRRATVQELVGVGRLERHVDGVEPSAANAALCIAGDAECPSGAPVSAKTRVAFVVRRTR